MKSVSSTFNTKNKLENPMPRPSYSSDRDPAAQQAYEAKKNTTSKNLNSSEKLELSWKFLNEITEKINSRFSPEDKKTLQSVGESLVKAGMVYQHNPNDIGVSSQNRDLSQRKNTKKEPSLSV